MIDALEEVVLAAPDEPATDPAEAEEVGRLVMVRTAPLRRDTLSAAWVRRPGLLRQVVPDAKPAPATGAGKPTPPAPERPAPAPPPWRE
jgi:hypothetical protein